MQLINRTYCAFIPLFLLSLNLLQAGMDDHYYYPNPAVCTPDTTQEDPEKLAREALDYGYQAMASLQPFRPMRYWFTFPDIKAIAKGNKAIKIMEADPEKYNEQWMAMAKKGRRQGLFVLSLRVFLLCIILGLYIWAAIR